MAASLFAAILQNRNLWNFADWVTNRQTESAAGLRIVGGRLLFAGDSEVP
jgi:hypothetical protein